MARNVKIDISQLKKFRDSFEKMGEKESDEFMESCAKELAARLLRKVVKRTPVGQYGGQVDFTTKDGKQVSFTPKKNKTGGTLRKGWNASKNASVHKFGTNYVIEITNPVEYASYVESGHRTRNHRGWVTGKFMLKISEDEIRQAAPGIIEKKLNAWLKEVMK